VREFNVNYKIKINENYDYGLYTDMSSIRKQIMPYFSDTKNVLNLFCYTGAFTLFALSLGATNVVSVDLSTKYLAWLQENLILNPELDESFHRSLNIPCDKALFQLKGEKRKFDLIICDPPSASSDGEKMTNALASYEELLPTMLEVLTPNGKIFAFLNTHQVSWKKFEERIEQIISSTPFFATAVIKKRFRLSDDYAPIKGFHEGDYLKGLMIELKPEQD
jgi:23S rRNA (cytosine1962-C5)-methyltransferase